MPFKIKHIQYAFDFSQKEDESARDQPSRQQLISKIIIDYYKTADAPH